MCREIAQKISRRCVRVLGLVYYMWKAPFVYNEMLIHQELVSQSENELYVLFSLRQCRREGNRRRLASAHLYAGDVPRDRAENLEDVRVSGLLYRMQGEPFR